MPILTAERILHKDYDRNFQLQKKFSGRETQGDWRKGKLIGSWDRELFGNPEEEERPPLKAATKQRQSRRACGHMCV
jgi:hypothetical protein